MSGHGFIAITTKITGMPNAYDIHECKQTCNG